MYKIKYTIPKTRFQRGSTNIIKDLDKNTAKDWTNWIISKQGTYIIIKY